MACRNNCRSFNGGYRYCEKPCKESCCSENKCRKKFCDYNNNRYHKRNGHDVWDVYNSDCSDGYESSEGSSCSDNECCPSYKNKSCNKFVVWKTVRKFGNGPCNQWTSSKGDPSLPRIPLPRIPTVAGRIIANTPASGRIP